MPSQRIAQERRNCWRVAHADRVAFLVDGANYYRALARALMGAEHSIFILGWDVHGGVRLLPDEPVGSFPTELGPLLNTLARKRRSLQAYILDWDFAVIYALERQMFPLLRLGWATHRRVHFRLDARHPLAGSHHQKVVVVDDKIAFLGGMDLASGRWDTPMHLVDDSRRIDPWGRPYPPHHDVQLAVDGEAAAALGELARERWRRATGQRVRASGSRGDPWPVELDADLRDADVALTRTDPSLDGAAEVREIETSYVDMIRAARHTIYIENQYFTAAKIGDALVERLSSRACPEIVVVLPYECHGWLEESAMGVLRARLIARMREADRHGKLRVYAPIAADGGAITVHSKVMVIDDVAVRVGSANLNNRSMGVDTECDAFVECGGRDDLRAAIRRFRDRLVGEHCGASAADATRAIEACGSLAVAIDRLRAPGRALRPLENESERWKDSLLPDISLLDPERPIEVWKLMESILPQEMTTVARSGATRTLIAVAAIAALAVAWSYTPVGEPFESARMMELVLRLEQTPGSVIAAICAMVVGGLLAAPVTVMIGLVGYLYGSLLGALIGLVGAMAAAALNFWIGRRLRRDTVRRLGGSTLNRVSRRLAHGGLMASFAVRFIPVAPFSVVNLVAGASRVDFREFFIGTLLAVAPAALAISTLGDQTAALLAHPSPARAAKVGAAALALVALGLGARRFISPERRRRA